MANLNRQSSDRHLLNCNQLSNSCKVKSPNSQLLKTTLVRIQNLVTLKWLTFRSNKARQASEWRISKQIRTIRLPRRAAQAESASHKSLHLFTTTRFTVRNHRTSSRTSQAPRVVRPRTTICSVPLKKIQPSIERAWCSGVERTKSQLTAGLPK